MQAHANPLGNYKLINEYVRISYLSKYSKYAEGLPINISQFYVHRFKYTVCMMVTRDSEVHTVSTKNLAWVNRVTIRKQHKNQVRLAHSHTEFTTTVAIMLHLHEKRADTGKPPSW